MDHRSVLEVRTSVDKAAQFWINMGGTAEYAGNFVPETSVLSAFLILLCRRGEHEEGSN